MLNRIPNWSFICANLFKIQHDEREFYVAQCLEDYRFTTNNRGMISDKYVYRVIGFSSLGTDYGKIILRPETRSDKAVGRFARSDIEIGTNAAFNTKHYIAADDEENARRFFNDDIVNVLSKATDLYLTVNKNKVIVSFENEMTVNQTKLTGSILRQVRE
jgi:hypothetical protein